MNNCMDTQSFALGFDYWVVVIRFVMISDRISLFFFLAFIPVPNIL